MPWQGHLWIGESVSNWEEVRAIYDKLGIDYKDIKDEWNDFFRNPHLPGAKRQVRYKDTTFGVSITFEHEGEGGMRFPNNEVYSDALVGFQITSRYSPAVIDSWCGTGGRPEPFEFDPQDLVDILKQVREWWPDAKCIIWTNFY